MIDALTFLTSFTLVLLAGIVAISVSKRTKIPLPLTLFFSGLILGNILYLDRPVIQFTGEFLSAFSIIALIVVLFDSISKIKIFEFDKSAKEAVVFFSLSLLANLVGLSYLARIFFDLDGFSSVIFSLLISCIEFNILLSGNTLPKNRVMQFLKDESRISCAISLLVPFLMISYSQSSKLITTGNILMRSLPLITDIFAGIGAGVVVSIILFRAIRSRYFDKIAPLVLAVGLLIAYLFAQKIGGNGLIAIATVGLIFGNIFLRHKSIIIKRENFVYNVVEVFIFTFIGAIVGLPVELDFYKASFALFLIYLAIRFLVSNVVLAHYDFSEKLEATLFVPKGVVTATAAFALLNYSFTGVSLIVQLLLVFFVYSLVLDNVLVRLGFYEHR